MRCPDGEPLIGRHCRLGSPARLSLKDAKDLVDGAPSALLQVPDQPTAFAAKAVLESAGATVSIIDLAS